MTLGLPLEKVEFEIGDTEMPKAPVHGGSITMASVGNGVKSPRARRCVRKLASSSGGDDAIHLPT